jgi:plastocyanin
MQISLRTRITAILAVTILVSLAACGNGEASDSAGAGGDASGGGGEAGATVQLTGFAFSPAELTVTAGTTVTFVNNDGAAHTVTEGTDGTAAENARFDEQVADGAEVTVTFDDPGTYQVTCTIHPSMNMTVIVEG